MALNMTDFSIYKRPFRSQVHRAVVPAVRTRDHLDAREHCLIAYVNTEKRQYLHKLCGN